MELDVNFMRSAVTVIGLLLFLVLVIRTWSRSRRPAFDEAAQLPFTGDANLARGAKPPGDAP